MSKKVKGQTTSNFEKLLTLLSFNVYFSLIKNSLGLQFHRFLMISYKVTSFFTLSRLYNKRSLSHTSRTMQNNNNKV